jgi:hypothetical protein
MAAGERDIARNSSMFLTSDTRTKDMWSMYLRSENERNGSKRITQAAAMLLFFPCGEEHRKTCA